MSSLSGYLRKLAERGIYDFEDIIEKYEAWVLDHRYMVLTHLREVWKTNAYEFDYVAVKCAKRGYDDRMDCVREDISVSEGNLAECEARVASFD